MFGLRTRVFTAALALLSPLLLDALAQSPPQLLASTDVATVRSVQVIQAPDGPAIEVLASRPVVPAFQKLEHPSRLVIDLPNSVLSSSAKSSAFSNEQIKRVRINQYQNAPPTARIVLDLTSPLDYGWDAAGNRLMIRLRATAQVHAKPPTAPALTAGAQPLAVPMNSSELRDISLSGAKVLPGSSVTAGADTAIMRLGRGGEVRVCPGTTVSLTSSQNGHALMLGMSTGALETHYYLDAAADSILTPDFRIQLPGPGEFHYAVSVDTRGNTCVRALPGNTASAIVSELLGDGTYQVKPNQQVLFHSGRLRDVDSAVPAACGCPPAPVPILRAAVPAEPLATTAPQSMNLGSSSPASQPAAMDGTPSQLPITAGAKEMAPLPPSKPNDVHVEVEAPFVFRGDDPPPAQPAPVQEAENLPLRPLHVSSQNSALPTVQIDPKPAHRGFFGKVKGFFSSLFG